LFPQLYAKMIVSTTVIRGPRDDAAQGAR